MSLSSLYLDAFAEVARLKSFSKAAQKLNVTQSALSQRILNLEHDLGSSLLIRDPAGLRLTDLGQRLLRYCHSKTMLESEFMATLKDDNLKSLQGIVRIGAYSTVDRSVILPVFTSMIREHPGVHLELRSQELRQLPGLLFSGAVDMVVVASPIEKQGIENHKLGDEEYVMIQSAGKFSRDDVYLDYDEEDTVTADFFKMQSRKSPPKFKQNFMNDIYFIMDAVRAGIGRAVVPLHLIQDAKGVEVVKGYQTMKMPVYLSYYTQAFYTELQAHALEAVKRRAAEFLRV